MPVPRTSNAIRRDVQPLDAQITAYAPTLREYSAPVTGPGGSGHVQDPGRLVTTNEAWEIEHPSDDQRLKLAFQSTVGPQYIIAGQRRTPRVTFLVGNPWVPTAERSPNNYSAEAAMMRIADGQAINDIPSYVRRDRGSNTRGD